MKNLDNSLLGSVNLDESISNTDGQAGTPSTSNSGTGGTNWADAIAASIALTNTVVQTRNTPKNEQEQACGVRPLFAGAKMDEWNKCVNNYNTSKTYTPPVNTNNNTTPEPKTFPWLLVTGITVGIAALGTIAYFVFRNK